MSRFLPRAVVAASALCALALAVGALTLSRQAALARRRIGKPLGESAPDADRLWQRERTGAPVELLLLGDSLAAGLGAERRKHTLGGRVAKQLASRLDRPVRLRTGAVVGAESAALAAQLDALPAHYRPDVALIVVGGNDVTHRIAVPSAVSHLAATVRRLRTGGASVVVGTCPDLGTLRPVPQPLRVLLAHASRRLADAQATAAIREGAEPVDLRRAVGRVFADDPDRMFSLDRFHPSGLGYRRTAEALLPALERAVRRAAAPTAPAPADRAQPRAWVTRFFSRT